jgi:hypothetical protein
MRTKHQTKSRRPGALAKSFIITCEGPVLNCYSLLPPHSIYSWLYLNAKFLQVFQAFHHYTTKTTDLYQCKQRDKEPLAEFVLMVKFRQPSHEFTFGVGMNFIFIHWY